MATNDSNKIASLQSKITMAAVVELAESTGLRGKRLAAELNTRGILPGTCASMDPT